MELKDIIITPFVILFVYIVAYRLRSKLTDRWNKKYYIPVLTLKICCAVALGLIYQHYYQYGDTLNYHTKGSRIIYQAFQDSPLIGLKLILGGGEYQADTYHYASKIVFYKHHNAYIVVKIAAIFDLFTFSSYAGTAVLFAATSFIGCWLFFLVFYKRLPQYHLLLALVTLFMPSVLFWGSGILKDSITFGALGVMLFYLDKFYRVRNWTYLELICVLFSAYLIFTIKSYILFSFLPTVLLWYAVNFIRDIRSVVLKLIIAPLLLITGVLLSAFVFIQFTKVDTKYSLQNIGETARVTSNDLAFGSGRGAGSTYVLGELDGSLESMIRLFPAAVNATLFRPYFWEVSNPFMLVAAFESFLILILTLYALYRIRLFNIDPFILFCLIFSVVFAFAIGVSTFNFGTLMRYKIPIIPFYMAALILIIGKYDSSLKESLK